MNVADTLRIVIVGHVDHGKSTLIGRLFYDTGSPPQGRGPGSQGTAPGAGAGGGRGGARAAHPYLPPLLGLPQVVVAVNKLDLVGYRRIRFLEIEEEIRRFLGSVGIVPSYVVPISAREGDNIAANSSRMPWYGGPPLSPGA